jgi:pimeloyl-ACP methyl ester carboxylesterase
MTTTIQIKKDTVQLSDGKTACKILGDPTLKNYLLVFGGFHFPRNCDRFFEALAEELSGKYALLLYDYWGRGDSDAPDGPYDVDMYMRQASDLVSKLGLQDKALHVMGYSFGGSTAVHFCHRYPDLAHSLILSGAWNTWEGFPAATRIMTKGGLSSMLYHFYWKAMPKALRDGFNDPDNHTDIIENMQKVERQFIERDPQNLKRSILRTFRNFTRDTQATVKAIAGHPRKVLIAWGTNDQIAPYKLAEAIHAAMPQSTLIGLDGNHNDIWLVPEKEKPFREVIVKFLGTVVPL